MAININVSGNKESVPLSVESNMKSLSVKVGGTTRTQTSASENAQRVPLRIADNSDRRSMNEEHSSPYYVGARAYVEQTEDGAVVTVIDKEGETTATVLNGVDGNGIAAILMNADYTLTIFMTNGTSVTTPPIRGEKGEKGDSADIDSITNAELEEMLV